MDTILYFSFLCSAQEGAHTSLPFGCQSGPSVSTIHPCLPLKNFPQSKSTICSANGPCKHLEAIGGQLFVISDIFMMLITHYDARSPQDLATFVWTQNDYYRQHNCKLYPLHKPHTHRVIISRSHTIIRQTLCSVIVYV